MIVGRLSEKHHATQLLIIYSIKFSSIKDNFAEQRFHL